MEQLLKILEDNARMSVEDIAAMLNKSPAEVAAMIDLARAQGIIKGYKTLVDWEKAGVNRVEAVIELNVSPKKLSLIHISEPTRPPLSPPSTRWRACC